MKDAVTSVDVFFLVGELQDKIVNSRVDSVYEAGERTVVFEVFKSGEGKASLVVAPDFLCVSQYKRDKPKHPNSFVMQLRKKLKGCFIRGIVQHAFDRIVEVTLEGGDSKYVLVLEVFSKGNIILLDGERMIIGLLEWQKWRDRKLGVKQAYEHPPETVNALSLSGGDVAGILASSGRDLVRCLAVECGLGGLYAEEVCARAKVEKTVKAGELGDARAKVIGSFESLIGDISSKKISPRIIL
ncbi:MAG: NFACT family protein, partial [Candidatus Altiarchaeota archaeon]